MGRPPGAKNSALTHGRFPLNRQRAIQGLFRSFSITDASSFHFTKGAFS